jgi:hypothetical protein
MRLVAPAWLRGRRGLAVVFILAVVGHLANDAILDSPPGESASLIAWHLLFPVVLMLAAITTTRFAANWRIRGWARETRSPRRQFVEAVLALLLVTEFFAQLTAVCYRQGWFRTDGGITSMIEVERYYLWNFVDAIPVLEVPKTLNWAEPVTFTDHASGAMLLAYKILIVIPFVALITALWRRLQWPDDTPPTSGG